MITLEFLRSFRFGGYAIFDFIVSLLGFYVFGPLLSILFLKIRVDIPPKNWLFLALPIGIAVHLVVGEMTPMTKQFLDLSGHYILKVVIFGLFVFGLLGIKIIRGERVED